MVVTRPATHSATLSFFRKHRFFGLAPGQVHLVANDVRTPLLDEAGTIAMENPGKVGRPML